mmetsp:Transcript_4409/g.14161  ORF Transcript_4409/g.14161 Transcript_4409/m.14161 type:complete len:525 (+) Transcript_4409:78-1652(+)
MVVSKPAKEGGRRFSVVVAACKQSRGIGVSNQLPWRLRGDMQYFKQLTRSTRDPTKQNAVIMGRKTWESIPEKMRPLGDRLNVVISANPAARELYGMGDKVLLATSLGDALQQLCEGDYAASVESVFVIGGSSVYAEAVDLPQLCERVYYTEVSKHAPLRDANGAAPPAAAAVGPATEAAAAGCVGGSDDPFGCDTHFPPLPADTWRQASASAPRDENGLSYRFLAFESRESPPAAAPHEELQYLDLVREVIESGVSRPDRTGIGTRGKFGAQMRFSLRDRFPLLTTKTVFWRGVAEELIWFLSGDTSAKSLQDKGIKIWDGNSSRDYLDSIGLTEREVGDLGPVYGWQWRHFGAEYTDMHADYTGKGVDQIAQVVRALKEKPYDRRIIMSAWNPKDLPKMALPPCHMFAQFYVANGELSCQMYQRSADLGLGVPFNIASYALLTCLLAHVTGLKRGDFVHVIGDAHVYNNHVTALREQLTREPLLFPQLRISDAVTSIEECTFADLELVGYKSHGKIKMDMAV